MANSRNKPRTEAGIAATANAALGRHVSSGQHVVVALSGGIDSVVLLHLLKSALPARGCSLSALHVHHGLSLNADAWQNFCTDLCAAWRIPLMAVAVSVTANGEGIEAAARAARHDAFAAANGDWVALAHHRGDQAETLLFNLLRGTGLRGAAAMRETNGRLLRPLLSVSRDEIYAYAEAHRLDWIDDESNADRRFSRNYLRHEVLSLLSSRFTAAESNLAAAARRFADAAALLDELALIDLAGRPTQFPLPVAVFAELSAARGRNLLRYLLTQHGVRLPSEERLVEALRQLTAAAPDRHPDIVFGSHRLLRVGGQVLLKAS